MEPAPDSPAAEPARRIDPRVIVAVFLSASAHLFGSAWAASTPVLRAHAHRGLVSALRLPDGEIELEVEAAVRAESLVTAHGTRAADAIGVQPQQAPELGGRPISRPDVGRAGRGGSAHGAQAINLADSDDGEHMSPELLSRFDRAQVFRNGAGAERRSPEDWSATRWRPTILTFESTGTGARAETRPHAAHDPSAGTWAGARSERPRLGPGIAAPGVAFVADGDRSSLARAGDVGRKGDGDERAGSRALPGAGVHDAQPGDAASFAADTAAGVPLIAHADSANPARRRGVLQDTLQSDEDSMTRRTSIVQASGPGGIAGIGVGGDPAPGAPGSGGLAGPGATSQALGHGRGGLGNVDPNAALRSSYLRVVAARIRPLWRDAFPRWAVLAGLGGSTIVSFVIQPDGSIAGASVTRPSGVPEFDENCRQAVLRAGPFEPLPVALGPTLHWAMTFTAKNNAVTPPRAFDE